MKELLNTTNNNVSSRIRMGYGSYTGNGESSRFISTAASPNAVFVFGGGGTFVGSYYNSNPQVFGGLALYNSAANDHYSNAAVYISGSGFYVSSKALGGSYGAILSNESNRKCNYVYFY